MLTIEAPTLNRLTQALGHLKNGVPKAITRAINHALDRGRTECWNAVKAEYTLKQRDLYASLNLRKASYGSLSGQIESRAPNLPVIKFDVKPKSFQQLRKKKRPVTVTVKRGGGGIVQEHFGGFIAETSRGVGVYERILPIRVPLLEAFTIGPASMLSSPNVAPEVERAMQLALDSEIDRQAALLLSQV